MVDVEDVEMFRTCLAPELDRVGVDVRLRTRALRLLVEDGAVSGAVVRGPEGSGAVRARAVILAAGGYQGNVELRRRYQPAALADTPYLGVRTDVGDGHVMGQAVGGDLINMTMIPPLIMVASAFVEDAIAVNARGERFHDEAGPYDERVAALLAQPDRRAHYIYDHRVATAKATLIDQMPEPAVQAPTLEALAELVGIEPDALTSTVAHWNAVVRAGEDPDRGRVIFPRSGAGIIEAPFSASPMVVGINFPAGGFRVTRDLQVCDVYGRTIPGLYAVGDCVGGIAPTIGLGGLKITPAVTLGRAAGRIAARGDVPAAEASGAPPFATSGQEGGEHLRVAIVDR